MADLRQAAQQALEALKSVQDHRPNDETNAAITALRDALAQGQAEQGIIAEQDKKLAELEAVNAELLESLRVAVDSDLGRLWVWPATARETWLTNARAAIAKAEGQK